MRLEGSPNFQYRLFSNKDELVIVQVCSLKPFWIPLRDSAVLFLLFTGEELRLDQADLWIIKIKVTIWDRPVLFAAQRGKTLIWLYFFISSF